MLVDPTLVDHQRLVASRLADEGIEFPSLEDLTSTVEVFKPQLFNFFSIHGKTVYICKHYSVFVLVCRNFNPAAQFGLSCVSHNVHRREFVVRKYTEFSLVMRDFCYVVSGLCNEALSAAAKEFSRG